MNSLDFDHIAKKIRLFFPGDELAIRDAIYLPIEEGCMPFMSLAEQGVIGFNAFLRAARAAFAHDIAEHPDSPSLSTWEEVLEALHADGRAISS